MWIISLFGLFILAQGTTCLYERVTEQVSVEIEGFHICYTLLNGTHQVGCQSDQDGNLGIVLYFENIQLIEHYDQLCVSGEYCYNFIVVIKFQNLNQKSVELLQKSSVVKGIIILERFPEGAKPLSEDSASPNSEFSAYSDNRQWNIKHAIHPSGFRFLDWKKPIFHVNNKTDVDVIYDNCYKKFNKPLSNTSELSPPYCYAKLTQFMLSAGDAETCIRRESLFGGFSQSSPSLCDPVEDENVIAVLPPMKINDVDPVEVFLLSARMDGFSTLTTDSQGDVSVLTSLIASLAVGEAIGRKMDIFDKAARINHRHLMFGFFNGESLGYIGSSRVVWDMQNARFPAAFKSEKGTNLRPINLTDIAIVMELQHIFPNVGTAENTYYAHTDWRTYSLKRDLVDAVANSARNTSGHNVEIIFEEPTFLSRAPPSSCHSFLRENASVPCLVISPFNKEYEYHAINSMSDRATVHEKTRLSNQIKALASSALYASLGFVLKSKDARELQSDFTINETYIDTLVECFIFSNDWHTCQMFKDILGDNKEELTVNDKKVYIGTGSYANLLKTLISRLLVQAIGTTKPTKNVTAAEQCQSLNMNQNVYRYVWLFDGAQNTSYCYRSSTYLTKARSPAFDIEDYDWSSKRYSTWAESVWQPPKLTLFLVAKDDWPVAMGIAAIVILISALSVWKIDELWLESGPVRNDAAL